MSADKPNKPPESEQSLVIESVEEIEEIAQVERAQAGPDSTLDPRTAEEQGFLSEKKSLKQQRIQTLFDKRIKYIPILLILIIGWLAVVAIFLAFTGFCFYGFTLSDKVLIALVTSTTANVLGLFYVVAKWLYPSPPFKDKSPRVKAKRKF